MARCVIQLPAPPSTNELFVQIGRRRVKTAKYSRWLREAAHNLTGVQPIDPPYCLSIHAGKANIARDPDNYWKAVLDLLVSNKIIAGDNWKYISALSIQKAFGTIPNGIIEVTISQAD